MNGICFKEWQCFCESKVHTCICCIIIIPFLSDGLTTKEIKKKVMQERQPVMEACDKLRDNLANCGIQIKVCEESRFMSSKQPFYSIYMIVFFKLHDYNFF